MSYLIDCLTDAMNKADIPSESRAPLIGHFCNAINVASFNPANNWPIKGVKVEGNTVIVSVKGGNDAARWLCGELIAGMKE